MTFLQSLKHVRGVAPRRATITSSTTFTLPPRPLLVQSKRFYDPSRMKQPKTSSGRVPGIPNGYALFATFVGTFAVLELNALGYLPSPSALMSTTTGPAASPKQEDPPAAKEEPVEPVLVEEPPVALSSPKEFISFTVQEVEDLSHNTKRIRFALPDGASTLGLPVAGLLLLRCPDPTDATKQVIRPYTPTTTVSQEGYFDLVVKKYPEGKMSGYLHGLAVGDSVEVKGPIVKLPYEANMKKEIGMVAGGTGITPMYQVAQHILLNSDDKTKVSLVFANVTESDILLRSELDGMAAQYPDRLSLYYVVDKAESADWTQGTGYVTEEMLKTRLPAPSQGTDAMVFVCGPPGMMKHISGDKNPDKSQGDLSGLLKTMGYTSEQVFKF